MPQGVDRHPGGAGLTVMQKHALRLAVGLGRPLGPDDIRAAGVSAHSIYALARRGLLSHPQGDPWSYIATETGTAALAKQEKHDGDA